MVKVIPQSIAAAGANHPVTSMQHPKTPAFKGREYDPIVSVFSKKAKTYIKLVEDIIEEKAKQVRKKRGIPALDSVLYARSHDKKAEITLRPLNKDYESSYLLEVKKGYFTEKININKRNPEKFTYERLRPTGYGSAVVRHYNSTKEKNIELNERVNGMIEEYLPLFFPKKSALFKKYIMS